MGGERVKYHIDDSEECEVDNLKNIILGNGKTYYIYRDNDPVAIVNINKYDFFTDAIIFNDYAIIGNYYEGIYAISLSDYCVRNIKIKGYFGYFEIYNDVLYVLGCENIVAIGHDFELIWESDVLAVDGVVCDCIKDYTMMISCEMDPPGGWIERTISLTDGKIIQ